MDGPRDLRDLGFAIETRTLSRDINGNRHGAAVRRLENADIARGVVERAGLVADAHAFRHQRGDAALARARAAHGTEQNAAAFGFQELALVEAAQQVARRRDETQFIGKCAIYETYLFGRKCKSFIHRPIDYRQ